MVIFVTTLAPWLSRLHRSTATCGMSARLVFTFSSPDWRPSIMHDPAMIAAADQELARLNRLLDAMLYAWQKARPTLAADCPDQMRQVAALAFALFAASDPGQALQFTDH